MESTAWCTCGDALETIPVMKTAMYQGKEQEVIDSYKYYCFGCDKTFVLVQYMDIRQ